MAEGVDARVLLLRPDLMAVQDDGVVFGEGALLAVGRVRLCRRYVAPVYVVPMASPVGTITWYGRNQLADGADHCAGWS